MIIVQKFIHCISICCISQKNQQHPTTHFPPMISKGCQKAIQQHFIAHEGVARLCLSKSAHPPRKKQNLDLARQGLLRREIKTTPCPVKLSNLWRSLVMQTHPLGRMRTNLSFKNHINFNGGARAVVMLGLKAVFSPYSLSAAAWTLSSSPSLFSSSLSLSPAPAVSAVFEGVTAFLLLPLVVEVPLLFGLENASSQTLECQSSRMESQSLPRI